MQLVQLRAQEQIDQPSASQVAHGFGRHEATIAEDARPVRDLEDLIEAVRDVQDTDTPTGHLPNDVQELMNFVIGQRGRGLVEHEKPNGGSPGPTGARGRRRCRSSQRA